MNMIPFSAPILHNKNDAALWQKEISNNFKTLDALLAYLEFDENQPHLFWQPKQFPIKVTPFYASLIKKNDPKDPLLLQIIPQLAEQKSPPNYTADAVGDMPSIKFPGLIHKYKGRALLSLTAACGIHCRYCFRRTFPYSDNVPELSENSEILNYLEHNTDIHEIILSGGDPLMLSDKKLENILKVLGSIDHIKTIRFHTRMPSILPDRITDSFLNMIKNSCKNIVLVTHINHAQEINNEVIKACYKIKSTGAHLLNQSVLLNNINNSVGTLNNLSTALFSAGILPYYLHCLDKVEGAAHFDLSRDDAKTLIRELTNQLPGYLIPRLVEEIEGEHSKTHIL